MSDKTDKLLNVLRRQENKRQSAEERAGYVIGLASAARAESERLDKK